MFLVSLKGLLISNKEKIGGHIFLPGSVLWKDRAMPQSPCSLPAAGVPSPPASWTLAEPSPLLSGLIHPKWANISVHLPRAWLSTLTIGMTQHCWPYNQPAVTKLSFVATLDLGITLGYFSPPSLPLLAGKKSGTRCRLRTTLPDPHGHQVPLSHTDTGLDKFVKDANDLGSSGDCKLLLFLAFLPKSMLLEISWCSAPECHWKFEITCTELCLGSQFISVFFHLLDLFSFFLNKSDPTCILRKA